MPSSNGTSPDGRVKPASCDAISDARRSCVSCVSNQWVAALKRSTLTGSRHSVEVGATITPDVTHYRTCRTNSNPANLRVARDRFMDSFRMRRNTGTIDFHPAKGSRPFLVCALDSP